MIILHARITQYFIVFALFSRPSLQASRHQGGDRYRTVGRQCTFNSLAFLIKNVKKDVEDWTSETLVRILRNGDWLCINTNLGESQYPLVITLTNKFGWTASSMTCQSHLCTSGHFIFNWKMNISQQSSMHYICPSIAVT